MRTKTNTEIPEHIAIKKLPTIIPPSYINEGFSSAIYRQKKRYNRSLHKAQKAKARFKKNEQLAKVKKIALKKWEKTLPFEVVFDLNLNTGGMFTYSEMAKIYYGLKNVNTEKRFLMELEKFNVGGYTRNLPMYNRYFPDFVWKAEKLIVEIDGPSHLEPHRISKDQEKDQFLAAQGWKVIRLIVPYDKERLKDVLEEVKSYLSNKQLSL